MFTEKRVVNNRVFLLGLDKLYRDAMKQHERGELLNCARIVAEALRVRPADIPIEGYYVEDRQLTEYFRLIRALQKLGEKDSSLVVGSLSEFRRLQDITSSPLYGRPQYDGKLLPTGRDALSQALYDTYPNWTVASLTEAANNQSFGFDEISLVSLAARIKDTVVLTALRESVVLYAERPLLLMALYQPKPPKPQYIWMVDKDLAEHAKRFIDIFNMLFGEELPPPDPSQVVCYWQAYKDNEIIGRCAWLGCDQAQPMRNYHWAIRRRANGEFEVHDFWSSEVWTTTRYQSALRGAKP